MLALRDDVRLPPSLGAQHPAGRDPALFDHLPCDGPSLSIGFDLSVRDHSTSQVNQALMTRGGPRLRRVEALIPATPAPGRRAAGLPFPATRWWRPPVQP